MNYTEINKMSNTDGLNTEESKWVCDFMHACLNGIDFKESPPSEKAANYIFNKFKEIGY